MKRMERVVVKEIVVGHKVKQIEIEQSFSFFIFFKSHGCVEGCKCALLFNCI